MRQLTLDVRLPENAGFAAFVPGRNTEVVTAVERHALKRDHPVVWLRGAAGVGKTHLLSAACNAVTDVGGSVRRLDGRDLVAAACGAHADTLADLLTIDDIDAVAGHAGAERFVFGLFNTLRDAGGAMLVAARPGPREVQFALPDLASRLRSGPVYRLLTLTDAERREALVARARLRGFELPGETVRYLMYRVPRDLCSLFALLDQLDSASLIAQRRLTVPFVREVLGGSDPSENV